MSAIAEQLTFNVLPDPRGASDGLLLGSLRIAGEFDVERDLNRGRQLTVQVADADGEILATAVAVVQAVGFVNITERGKVVGTQRQHKAKLGDA